MSEEIVNEDEAFADNKEKPIALEKSEITEINGVVQGLIEKNRIIGEKAKNKLKLEWESIFIQFYKEINRLFEENGKDNEILYEHLDNKSFITFQNAADFIRRVALGLSQNQRESEKDKFNQIIKIFLKLHANISLDEDEDNEIYEMEFEEMKE